MRKRFILTVFLLLYSLKSKPETKKPLSTKNKSTPNQNDKGNYRLYYYAERAPIEWQSLLKNLILLFALLTYSFTIAKIGK